MRLLKSRNDCKRPPQGQKKLQTHCHHFYQKPRRWIEISVIDNGPGIPEEIKNKIFQPFFTTKPTGEGTGLGLSLSYDIIVKLHGGEIKVNSALGAGTEFIIVLPK
jgi:signal transduction histidine kinase